MFKGLIRFSILLLVAIQLTACGGGGEDEPAPTVKLSRTITFSQPNSVTTVHGDSSFTNTIDSLSGSGILSHTSSNPAIATVSDIGLITVLNAGSSIISAHITEDAKYKAASASYELIVNKAPTSLSFDNTGTVALLIEQTYTNPITPESGNVNFSSNDSDIASIDSAGVVTAKTAGQTLLTATLPESDNYLEATSSFIVSVAPQSIALNLLIGSDDTLVSTEVDTPLQLARTSQADCDFADISHCDNGLVDELTTEPLLDTILTTSTDGYFALQHGEKSGKSSFVSTDQPPHLLSPKAISFQGYLWLFGGYNNKELTNNIWRSLDGNIWELVTENAGFSARTPLAVFELNNQLWLIGSVADRQINDVWRSSDGVNWTLINADLGYADRNGYVITSFNDKMWIYGGYDFTADEFVDEIWSSEDGLTWTQEATTSTPTQRTKAAFAEFNDKLWQIGGRDSNYAHLSDVWSSADGIEWIRESADAGFMGRNRHQVNTVNNTLILTGGFTPTMDPNGSYFLSDTWVSTDGIHWDITPDITGYGQRKSFATAVHNDKLLVLNGRSKENNILLSENWQTTDGKDWQPLNAQLPAMAKIQAFSHNQQIMLLSGENEDRTITHALWRSFSGYHWQRASKASLPLAASSKFFSFNNKLWSFAASGGHSSIDGNSWTLETTTVPYSWNEYSSPNVFLFDGKLWSIDIDRGFIHNSTDGKTWKEVNNSNNFPKRDDTKIISFQGKMWVLAGRQHMTKLSDIWSSSDGVTWSLEANNTSLGARGIEQVVLFNGKLWAFGGEGSEQQFNDLWHSTDGVSWTKAVDELPFFASSRYKALVHDNKLVIMGGYSKDPVDNKYYFNSNEVWISSNGIDWRRALRHELSF
ncbi:hypothetical protein EKG38_01225 [Shewanella canadensis]|uniref:DUF6242 domain-containing protein n=1 Tax=Shewanella canadensis TaxID=271096 RepID=A0A3S0J9A2_9GAMM|nr:hypothetical protein [Shewanella canadensis]RTR40571.1 hypothetical protein EKG38_01225 [Shewanella canadensis]